MRELKPGYVVFFYIFDIIDYSITKDFTDFSITEKKTESNPLSVTRLYKFNFKQNYVES
jgi:hypothetical protein